MIKTLNSKKDVQVLTNSSQKLPMKKRGAGKPK